MWIDIQSQLLFFVADFLSPDRRERKKEPLLRGEAVDFFVPFFRMFLERLLQRSVGKLYATDVGDVLALSKRAIHMQSRQRLIFIVLIDDRLRAFLEFLTRL